MNGREFHNYRYDLGWSQAYFAQLIGVHPSSIWRFEHDKAPIPRLVALLLRIASLTDANRVLIEQIATEMETL